MAKNRLYQPLAQCKCGHRSPAEGVR